MIARLLPRFARRPALALPAAEPGPCPVTRGILEYCDHRAWQQHHFGLPPSRWQALSGKSIWVVGAGTGYGRAIAVMLAAAGARPILSGRRREKLEESCVEMRALGADPAGALIVPCDFTREAQLADAAGQIAAARGALDGLVLCAALPQPRQSDWPLSDLPLSRWQAMVDTNVTGPWLAAKVALPLMLSTGAARMLLFTSEAGWAATPGFGPYNTTKAALNSLGASLAAEAATRYPGADVQINVLNPGEARTEMNGGSQVSPYAVVSMTLALLSHPPGGPNGCFFARDGRHLEFAYARAWPHMIL
jgi:NAD(P)-dependent dehydrogenase (short-subunit alcohol dehydrogenase family)